MASSCVTTGTFRHHFLAILCAAVATASAVAQPDLCFGPLPTPGAEPTAEGGAKFKLITQQCPELGQPAQARRAAQLDLPDSTAPVAITLPAEAAPAEAAPSAPPTAATPPDRNALRVLALAPALTAAAREYDIDPLLLHAIAHIESRHNAHAVSPVGARGVMQVMPATARRFGVTDPEQTLFNANTNLRASAAYLRLLRTRYGDDLQLVLAAYNAGEGAVDKHGGTVPPYPETQAYVRDVLAVYRLLTESFKVSPEGTLIARADSAPAKSRGAAKTTGVRSAKRSAYASQEEPQ